MTRFVILTDMDDDVTIVACEDLKTAEAVGSTAIRSPGGVSAWLVPDRVLTDVEMVKRLLRAGSTVQQLREGVGRSTKFSIELDSTE